jgi:hypothetical protein
LAVSKKDAARFLLKFDVPVRKTNGLVRADMVLHPDAMESSPASAPLRLEVYRITEGWNANELSWGSQPAIGKKAAAVFEFTPGQAEAVHVDITAVAKSWLEGGVNHGVMVKARAI